MTGSHVLYENMERYRSIIAASNTGAWEYHADTHYQWCSAEYFEMLGYDPKVFLPDNKLNINVAWFDLLHPDDKAHATEKFARYLASGAPGMYENFFRMRHQRGNWVWIWSRAQTLRKHDGTLSNITLGTPYRLHGEKNSEIELKRHNEKLIKYAHLNAHDVRGPLARILGLIHVRKLSNDTDHEWCFEKIEEAARDIDRILKIVTKELNEIEEHSNI